MMAISQPATPIKLLALKACIPVNSYAVTAHLTLAILHRTVQIMKTNLSKLASYMVSITVNQLLAPFSIHSWLHIRKQDRNCLHPLAIAFNGQNLETQIAVQAVCLPQKSQSFVVLMDITYVLLQLYCLFLLQIILHCDCM